MKKYLLIFLPALLLSFPALAEHESRCETYEQGVEGLSRESAKTGNSYATVLLTEAETDKLYDVLFHLEITQEGGVEFEQFAFGITSGNRDVVVAFPFDGGCMKSYFLIPASQFKQITNEYGSTFPEFEPVIPAGKQT